MAYTKADLDSDIRAISLTGIQAINDLQIEFDEINVWLDSVEDSIKCGHLTLGHFVPKTPAKKRGVLGTINESVSNTSLPEYPELESVEVNKQLSKKKSKEVRGKRKQDQSTDLEDIVDDANDSLSKRRKKDAKTEPVSPLGDDRSVESSAVSIASELPVARECEPDAPQRRTRSQIHKITLVKETRQTFVVETVAEKSESIEPPVLKSPSPIRVSADSSNEVFKSPLPLREPSVESDDCASPTATEIKPPQRITRTKTRAMAKAKEAEKKPESPPSLKKSDASYTSGHDSDEYTLASTGSSLKPPVPSFIKQKFETPGSKTFHATNSMLATPTASNVLTSVHSFITKPAPASVKKVREEDYLIKLNQKTAEAIKKREELIKAQTEEKMRKRQEKTMKVNAAREAMEKERAEKLRLQIVQEEIKQKEEMAKRRKLLQQKAAEAARLAKRQQEEEQRRLAEERKKKLEEAERLRKEEAERERLRKEAEERERLRREEAERERLRKESEERERLRKEAEERERVRKKEAERERARKEEAERARKEEAERERLRKEAEKAAAAKAALASKMLNETYVKPASYELTPLPADRQPVSSKSSEDYGIDDARCDDSSDDESNPKKQVPAWAEPKNRARPLTKQCDYFSGLTRIFFDSKRTTPDLSKMFKSIDRRLLIRKSSAVWNTPPIKFNRDI